MNKFILILLLLCVSVTAFAVDVNARYTAALEKMQQGKRLEALKEFRELATSYSNHTLTGNFHYWSGEALLGLGRVEEATAEYALAASVKNSNKEKHARFMLGQCYMKLGKLDKAKAEWERFLRDYPDDELAPKVKQRMKSE